MAGYEGIEGESVFCKPFWHLPQTNPMVDLYPKVEAIDDPRLNAIVWALLLENRLDVVNALICPGYQSLGFMVDRKIKFLRAFRLIPPFILDAGNIVVSARNEFAHELDRLTFEDLPEKLRARIREFRCKTMLRYGTVGPGEQFNLSQQFQTIAFTAVAGVDAYRDNLRIFREKIDSPEFVKGLSDEAAAKNRHWLWTVTHHKPIRVEETDRETIEYYENGVVRRIGKPRR